MHTVVHHVVVLIQVGLSQVFVEAAYPTDKARKALTDLGGLALKRFATADLAAQALDLAVQKAITAYDACYVALALRLSVPFVTADEKLARAVVCQVLCKRAGGITWQAR